VKEVVTGYSFSPSDPSDPGSPVPLIFKRAFLPLVPRIWRVARAFSTAAVFCASVRTGFFGADSFTVESHLLNFHPIALNEETPLTLVFLKRLRDERRFPNPDALKEQIGRDVATAKHYFSLCRAVASKPQSGHRQPAFPAP